MKIAALLLLLGWTAWAQTPTPVAAPSLTGAGPSAATPRVPLVLARQGDPGPLARTTLRWGHAASLADGKAPLGVSWPSRQLCSQCNTARPRDSRHRILWAAVAGAAAGGVIGARGLNFSALPSAERTPHRWRAGLTYGAIGGVLGAAFAARTEPGSPPHRFFWDKWNTPLFTGVAAVQALDFASTRYFRDRGKDEYLLTNSLVDNRPAFAATELAAASAAVGLSYLFHHAGHHRLERWVAGAYIAVGVVSAVANYRYPRTGHALFGN